jgi:hypothetical protein
MQSLPLPYEIIYMTKNSDYATLINHPNLLTEYHRIVG